MNYTLQEFCVDAHDLLVTAKKTPAKCLPEVAEKLSRLLGNEAFIAATFKEDTPPGKELLYHDRDKGFFVFAHVQQAGKGGAPHSHGESWAIYGNARGYTDMAEWRRVNPESEDHAVLERTESYRIGPGDTRAYGPGVIHSTAHPQKAWVIRVTGGDLDVIPRYQFRPKRDKILEKA